ncbi:MAG: sensor histidine kinase [Chloroflexota bacterium]
MLDPAPAFWFGLSAVLRRFRSHISTTLVVWSVVLAVAPVAIILSFALNQADQQAHQQVIAQLESVASIKDSEIERWLSDQGTILDLVMNDSDKEQAVIQLLQGDEPAQAVSGLLAEHLNGQQSFTEIFIYDPDGQIRTSTTEVQTGKIVRDQPYFKPSLTGNYIQPPYYEVSTSDLNIMVSRPILAADGSVMGVLAGRLQLGELSQIMTERAGLGNSGETYLVSPESNYLVTASRFEGYPLTRAYHSLGIDAALAGGSGTGTYADYRGVLSIGVYQWIPELQSALLAEIDESEALTSLHQVRDAVMLAALVVTALAVGIGLALALRITRPIVALTRVANQIAAGDYSLRSQVNRQDELGQLGNAFNIMTKKLTDSIDELNLRMEELKHTNADLTVATAQAHESVRAKDAFLAVMSHELRTPLNAIMGFAELIERGGQVEGRTLHKIQRIRDNGARLLILVTNVLDITRIASGKLQLIHAPVDLRQLILDLSGQMEILAQTKGLEFKVEIDDSIPCEVVASREALTKIITNLLANAFKFTEQGEVLLKVCRRDDQLELEISDSGIGIPPDRVDTVFEPFRQADDSAVKRVYGGTGLGLAIVKQLCVALGGWVTLKSVVGQGSTFRVILPFETQSNLEVDVL